MNSKQMKKIALIGVYSLAFAVFAVAAIVGYDTFNASGDGCVAVIPAARGTPVCASMNLVNESNGTFTVYRPSLLTRAWANSATTNLIVKTDANGAVRGHSLVSTDNILIHNATSNYQFRTLNNVVTNGYETNLYVTLQFTGVVGASSNDVVWIGLTGDTMTIPVASGSTVANMLNPFSGKDNMPVVVKAAAGSGPTTRISGSVEYVQ